jgi:hypothetical protein
VDVEVNVGLGPEVKLSVLLKVGLTVDVGV